MGIEPGDRVVIAANLRPEWLLADSAIMGIGGVSAAIPASLPPEEMVAAVADVQPRAGFVSQKAWKALQAGGGPGPSVKHLISFGPIAPSEQPDAFSAVLEVGGQGALFGTVSVSRRENRKMGWGKGATGAAVVGEAVHLAWSCVRALRHPRTYIPLTFTQTWEIGVTSIPLVVVVAMIAGAVTSQQSGYQFSGTIPMWVIASVVTASVITELGLGDHGRGPGLYFHVRRLRGGHHTERPALDGRHQPQLLSGVRGPRWMFITNLRSGS